MKFGEYELNLLKKIGMSEQKIKELINPQPKRKTYVRAEKPINHSLVDYSGEIKRICHCCGMHTVEYIDCLKRHDLPGHIWKSVEIPTFEVKIYHTYTVRECRHCTTKNLLKMKQEELIQMILNLRRIR